MGRLRGEELSPRRFHPRRSGHGFVSDDLVGRQARTATPGQAATGRHSAGTDCLPEDQSQTATEDRPDGAPCFDGKTLRWGGGGGGEKEWRFRKQAGPVQWLLSALESATDGSRSGV